MIIMDFASTNQNCISSRLRRCSAYWWHFRFRWAEASLLVQSSIQLRATVDVSNWWISTVTNFNFSPKNTSAILTVIPTHMSYMNSLAYNLQYFHSFTDQKSRTFPKLSRTPMMNNFPGSVQSLKMCKYKEKNGTYLQYSDCQRWQNSPAFHTVFK